MKEIDNDCLFFLVKVENEFFTYIYRVNLNFLENLLIDFSSLNIQYYLILGPFLEFFASKPVGKSLFFNCFQEKKKKKITLSSSTQTAVMQFEKGSLF